MEDAKAEPSPQAKYFTAVHDGKLEEVPNFFDGSVDITLADPKYLNYTALHSTCLNNHFKVFDLVASRQEWKSSASTTPPVNTLDADDCTALFHASKLENPEYALKLLSLNADPSIVSKQKRTACHQAAYFGRGQVLRALLDALPSEKRADVVNQKGEPHLPWYGRAALHEASEQGHAVCADMLIAAGAIVSDPDADGNTPLHTAAYNGKADCVLLLIDRGALIDAVNKAGLTPFQVACKRSHWVAAQMLIEAGAEHRDNPTDATTEEEKKTNIAQSLVMNDVLSSLIIPELACECASYLHSTIATVIKDCHKVKGYDASPVRQRNRAFKSPPTSPTTLLF